MNGCLVELPGTAPGSDPLITRAFMSIVPRDMSNIGGNVGEEKGGCGFLSGRYPKGGLQGNPS